MNLTIVSMAMVNPGQAGMIAEEIKAALDSADEHLVRMLFQIDAQSAKGNPHVSLIIPGPYRFLVSRRNNRGSSTPVVRIRRRGTANTR